MDINLVMTCRGKVGMLDEGAGEEGDLVVFGGRVEGFVENTKFSLGLAD